MKPTTFAAAFTSIAIATGTAAAQTVGLGTSPAGAFFHTQGVVIASAMSEHADIQMRVQPFSSFGIYIPAIDGGELEFGLGNIFETWLATSGKLHFEGKATPNLRMVTATSTLKVAYFVRKDSPIQTLADMKGQRVVSGFTQQRVIQPVATAHFAAAGLTEADFRGVPVPNVGRGADDFIAGRADVFFHALGSAKVTETDAAVGGIRGLPLPETDEARAAIREHVPPAYIYRQQPSPGIAGIPEPTPVLAYDSVMVTGAHVPDDLVYRVAKAIYDRAEQLQKATPTLGDLRREWMAKPVPEPVQYHPGAIKFYTEQGLWPPKE